MQYPRPFAIVVITTLCIIVGDSILRLTSLGKLPMTSGEWIAVLVRPELFNAIAVIVIVSIAQSLPRANTIMTAGALALLTTAVHRWIVGSVFTNSAVVVTAIIFFVLSWVSLWIANTVTEEREHKHS